MLKTILVVEDDENINQLVTEYLKSSGFVVLSFKNGKSALDELLQSPSADLFVLDIMLPEISGLEILRQIRESADHKEKPVIMLTALQDEYTQLISFDGLADDYLTKPFSMKILVKRVQALLRRTGQSTNTINIGNIMIDLENYEVFEKGAKVPLTLREFELLSYLANNQSRVISRQQLLNNVWGYSYFGDERIVDAHIKNLRKKIKADVVKTVMGIGYKIDKEMGL